MNTYVAGSGAPSDATATARGSVLEVRSLSKTFAGTRALDGLDFDLVPGEVHSVVGQNGSGKSTLIKLLAGYHTADPGAEFSYYGEPVHQHDISRSLRFVHQDLGLVSELSAVENLGVRGGLHGGGRGLVRRRREIEQVEELLASLGLVGLDVTLPVSEATMAERTIIALGAAVLNWDRARGGVLVLDEPTATLPPGEARRLIELIEDLRNSGASIVYVSHRLDEIIALSDRVTVLRNGRHVATCDTPELTKSDLVTLMVGAGVDPDYHADLPRSTATRPVLEVKGIAGRKVHDATFTVYPGEIVGIVGLPDSGRDELPQLLVEGPALATGGQVRMSSETADWSDIRHWRPSRAVMVPADRGRDGVVTGMTTAENLSLRVLDSLTTFNLLSPGKQQRLNTDWFARLGVVGQANSDIRTLSGGNQQKVLLARCLATSPELLILCEPTAGVDVGARQSIYAFIAEQVRQGLAVLVSSSDVTDILALCSRVLALRDGRVERELTGEAIAELPLVRAMEGLTDESPAPKESEY